MIKKLKIKFVLLCMLSLFALLSVLVIVMNTVNYSTVVTESDNILNFLIKNNLISHDEGVQEAISKLPYEVRFFSVMVSDDGSVLDLDLNNISTVDAARADEFVLRAMQSDMTRGFLRGYRYVKLDGENAQRQIVFLDCARQIRAAFRFFIISLGISFAGFALVFLVITFMAGRILKPIIDSYEKQKRFITDAGHEIKTPLTIINANVDVLEMEMDENECLIDIRQQTQRLTDLTNDLVYLARMEESADSITVTDVILSDLVDEVAASFKTLAATQEKDYTVEIQSLLSVKGNTKYLVQLINILLDNAIKYSPKGGKIRVTLSKQGRSVVLMVENTSSYEITRETLKNAFDRFYRPDPSRSSSTGGYGIGLSVAKAIASFHQARIQASSTSSNHFRINVAFPISRA